MTPVWYLVLVFNGKVNIVHKFTTAQACIEYKDAHPVVLPKSQAPTLYGCTTATLGYSAGSLLIGPN